MTGDCHVQFFGKGVDTYFQARVGYEVASLHFQSMYIAIFRRLVAHFMIFLFSRQFQVLSGLVLRFFFFFFFFLVFFLVGATFAKYDY